jgi:molybdopterin/thiamine biosynthesis adenylyltransferase
MSTQRMPNLDRYSRQIVLEQLGKQGQKRLLEAHISIVGLGALGTVSSTLLARAGVGQITLIDRDVVELVNLQRQVLYGEDDIGLPKAPVAAAKLRQMNSSIRVEGLAKDLNSANVLRLLKGSELVLDGTDNLETRFLLNEACVETETSWVYAGVVATEGRVMSIIPGKTACFRCFSRRLPAPGTLPTCETAGVLNSVAAATASLQVTEAIKLMVGEKPSGHLLVLDGWSPELLRIKMPRNRSCPVCVGGEREYLGGSRFHVITALCGGNTISFDPLHKDKVDLAGIAMRLGKIGKVKVAGGVVIFETGRHRMTIFEDGRALVKGARSSGEARSLYSKYIGL